MPFDANFLELMNATVEWSPFIGMDSSGNPAYGDPVADIPALYVGVSMRGSPQYAPQGVTGQPSQATYTVYVPPQPSGPFRPRDKILLDNGVTTFARVVNIYQDPVAGDPGFVVIETEEYR